MSLVLCHDFTITPDYSLGYLMDRYKNGQPIQLLPLVETHGRPPAPVPDVAAITKHRLRIRARADLAPHEFEATHLARIGR